MSKLEELEILEKNSQVVDDNTSDNEVKVIETNKPNSLDGYHKINNYDLPQSGILYPENWSFAYRCPTAKEVANFSTVNENDQPAIIAVIEDLIRSCVVIYDTINKTTISTGEICDAHRIYFLLLIRNLYLPASPIVYKNMCQTCHETFDVVLDASNLEYRTLNEKLLNAYNGRIFNLEMNKTIRFRVPTLETTGRLFKYIVKAYRSASSNKEKKEDNVVFDKQFILLAPYLFESGKERIQDIVYKYKQIMKDDELFRNYVEIINKINLDNSETFDSVCKKCGAEEEAEVKFPGGFKKLFISTTDSSGYFD